MLALIVMLPLLLVARVTVPATVVTLALALTEPPVIKMVVLPPVTVPVAMAPSDVAVSVRVPKVMVCPVPV